MGGTSGGAAPEQPWHGAGPAQSAFDPQAFLYAGLAGFLDGALPFIQAGIEAGEPVLVVVGASGLRGALGDDAHRVSFADMAHVGRDPARIIPAGATSLAQHAGGRPGRGIGERVWRWPSARSRSWSSASVTRRCSTWRSPVAPPGASCARTTPRRWPTR